MPKVGIIAGSGFYEIGGVKIKETREITTPFGNPSDAYRICEFSGREFAFLARHGSPHRLPPHGINYRANIWGLRRIGVERVFSVNAVGGISSHLRPGEIVIPNQIIDLTHGRISTFHEQGEVVHIDFTDPYCPELMGFLLDAGKISGIDLRESATYVCVNGPRLETKAEIAFFANMGGDVVGMTGMPEACLARELEMCFAGIAVVTNYAAGISPSRLTTAEVIGMMEVSIDKVKDLIFGTLPAVLETRSCECGQALKDARM